MPKLQRNTTVLLGLGLLLPAMLFTVSLPVWGASQYVQLYDIRALYEVEASLYSKDNYAWGLGPALDSLVRIYETTGDVKYLDRLVKDFRIALRFRDDQMQQADYRGRYLPAWGTAKYSNLPGKHYVWAVHTGMITYPIARFIRLVKENPALQPQFIEVADEFLIAVKQAVAVHDSDFVTGPGSGEGYYTFADAANKVGISVATAPFNMQNALGRTMLELYRITGDTAYQDKVTRMAMFMRNRLFIMPDGGYAWMYHMPPFKLEGPRKLTDKEAARLATEDVSHAAINVDFMVEAYKAGIVFTNDDMQALVKTVLNRVFDQAGQASDVVGGGKPGARSNTIGNWLGLAPYSKQLYEKMTNYYSTIYLSPSLEIISRLALADQYWSTH